MYLISDYKIGQGLALAVSFSLLLEGESFFGKFSTGFLCSLLPPIGSGVLRLWSPVNA
ncbi:hypothetical protein Hdeb2414_s0443g00894991 [Helianthus debilis subsp. tardiflorus]